MRSFKIIGLFLLSLIIIAANNDAYSQKKKKKKSDDDYYTVPRSEYMMLEDGKIYPIEGYGYYDYTAESDTNWDSNYTLPELIETENYTIHISQGDSFKIKSSYFQETDYQEVDRKLLNDVKRYGKYFSIKDTCIVLKLANGTKSYYYPAFLDSLTPMMSLLQNQELKPRWYYFEGYVKHLDAYLINWVENVSYYEKKEGYLLVSAKDGSEISFGGTYMYESLVPEIPIISSDQKKILFVNNSGIRIYNNENGHFHEEINALFFDEYNTWYGYVLDVKWETENSFLIYLFTMDSTQDYPEQFKRVTITKK